MLCLDPAEIHLWCVLYEQVPERLLSAYYHLLSTAEREQERRFYFARDRRRYLITRALVRTVLARYAPIDPRDWQFVTDKYGRPESANALAKNLSLVFNISHTHGMIVLGVTKRRALGVDIENVRSRCVSTEIADRYFAPDELAVLRAAPRDQWQYRFFEYWTLKEAYAKARGMGLSLPFDKFSFHYPDNHDVNIAICPELRDDCERWQFWQLRPTSEYLTAVCAERTCALLQRLVTFQAIPLLSEERISPEVLRASKRSATCRSDDATVPVSAHNH